MPSLSLRPRLFLATSLFWPGLLLARSANPSYSPGPSLPQPRTPPDPPSPGPPNISRFFPSPATIVSLSSLSRGSSRGISEAFLKLRDPQICTFGLSGSRVPGRGVRGRRVRRLGQKETWPKRDQKETWPSWDVAKKRPGKKPLVKVKRQLGQSTLGEKDVVGRARERGGRTVWRFCFS